MKKILTLICLVILFNITESGAQSWISMGGSLGDNTQDVKAICVDQSGNIYVGGTFTSTTGGPNYLAKWNGSSWATVGSGVNGPVFSISARTANDLYIGGKFTTAGGVSVSNVARLDGSGNFSILGSGLNDTVRCIYAAASGGIYAGGNFTQSGSTPTVHVAQYSGGAWSQMSTGLAVVNCFAEFGTFPNVVLYAGCDDVSNPVMKWSGSSWTAQSGLSSGRVLALASFGNQLYAGGDFQQPCKALAKFDGTSWATAVTNFNFGQRVNALLSKSDALYVGGNYTGVGFQTPNYIARVPLVTNPLLRFTVMTSDLTNGEVLAIGKNNGIVYAGGKFTTPASTVNISQTDQGINVDEISNVVISKKLFPNPVHGNATLTIGTSSLIKNPELKIYDVQSKLIQAEINPTTQNNELIFDINIGPAPKGNYFYVLFSEGKFVTSDMFIVE